MVVRKKSIEELQVEVESIADQVSFISALVMKLKDRIDYNERLIEESLKKEKDITRE